MSNDPAAEAPDAQEQGPGASAGATGGVLPLLVMGLVVVSWGMGPPFSKLVSAPPMVASLIRFGLSTPFLLAVLALRGRWLSRQVFWRSALPGLCFGINLVFIFASVQEVTISVLSVMLALQPAMLLALVGPIFGDRVSLRQIAFTLVGVAGAVGVIAGAGAEFRATGLGLLLAAMAVLTFTVYFVLTRVARSAGSADATPVDPTDGSPVEQVEPANAPVDPLEWMTGVNFWSLVAVIPPAIMWTTPEGWREFGGLDWLWIVIIAFITGVFGHVLMAWCHAHIEVARSSLYVLAMHIVAVGLAWLIHDEPVTLLQIGAGAVVLFSVAMVIRTPAAPPAQPERAQRTGPP